jgi:tRNA uridine 5-carbamoylmethylation protein Kti12
VPSTNHEFHAIHSYDHDKTGHANEHVHRHDFEILVQRFEDPKREEWQYPGLIIQKRGDVSGKKVGDIRAGTGYFSFRLAKLAKKVIAIENRIEYFSRLVNKLGKDAMVIIVDFKKEEMPVDPPFRIKLSEITVVNELVQAGYPNINLDKSSLPHHYIITARQLSLHPFSTGSQ